ncbi:MAG: YobA family protein [Acidobacteriota bacterium]|nr:YobA family protein [Acidobacteriota bacterium]
MSRIYLMLSIWLLCPAAAATNAACASPNLVKTQITIESEPVAADADITGRIVKINRASPGSANKDFLGSIYVEGSGNYDRANINIKTETRIFVLKNGKRRAADFDNLQVNARVQAAFSGPVLESYPVQATAAEIVVLADGDNNQEEPNDKTHLPLTKTDYLRVEGERRRVTLRLFDEVDLPFAAYYPENDFIPETGASDEGQSLRFVSKMGGRKNENAYVHIFFPYRNSSPAQVRRLVSGNRGLLKTNGWRVKDVKPNKNYNFAWAKEQIFFADRNNDGFVLIGRQQNRAFYVIVHYPKEYAEGFLPRAEVVLKNLLVKKTNPHPANRNVPDVK